VVADVPSPADEGTPDVEAFLRQASRELLDTDTPLIGHRPLAWYGFDSIMATELKARIDAAWQVDVPAEVLVAGPSLEELTQVVAELVTGASVSAMPSDAPVEDTLSDASEPTEAAGDADAVAEAVRLDVPVETPAAEQDDTPLRRPPVDTPPGSGVPWWVTLGLGGVLGAALQWWWSLS
jgi:aryl carrier-like protein